MAVPTVVGTGADNSGTTAAVTYTLPAHQADDILILVVETNVTGGVSAPTGWAHITGSPQAQGSNVTSVSVMWKRAASSSETNPQVSGAANHQVGFAFAVRGCVTTGDPWDFAPVGSGAASGSNMSATGGTTTVTDALIICASGNSTDIGTDNYTTLANTTLSDEAFLNQAFTLDGNGGGAMVATGSRATAGATGTFTATITTAGATANIVFALKPATGAFTGSASIAETAALTSSGVTGKVASASLAESATITATGTMAAAGSASVAETVSRTASGVVGKSATGALSETAAVTSSGVVGKRASATIAQTVTISASGSVGGGSPSASATVATTVTVTAAGVAGTKATATITETVTLTSAGRVGKVASATVATTVTITATGRLGTSASATRTQMVTITAAGTVADPGAYRDITATATLHQGYSATLTRRTLAATLHQPWEASLDA